MTHEAFVFPAHPVAAPTSGLCHAAIPSISAAGRATSTSPSWRRRGMLVNRSGNTLSKHPPSNPLR
ncbi:hypothetical protein BDA96_05G245000 [Sorghum bicolor]|uniref:Uncharacterized protein n=2 Tax=Sorghum bicolor TaxID=4558 RepID=A0A921UGE5_SORBI|nr:hypothetical protein BDA96_05G245000 [Sorghum bicolor]KAG0531103.1 hypothetical protein BDA96_05G245000 [Sorghum bicolor]KXG29210.1 hypothetical protein SORBI_3005G227500 [Sorghum bicolor]KXG29211.1 hypothetical protein SORBI_3005G227500 [Sorghum bicolor]